MEITIQKVKDCSYHEVINLIQSDSELKKIFAFNCLTRVGFSPLSYFILADQKRIGFISLIDEGYSYNIDSGLIAAYRNQGIGSIAMKLFLKEIEQYKLRIVVETKVNNDNANIILKKNNFVLVKTKNSFNFYEFAEPVEKKKLKKK